jgi:acyl-CoA synthetase (AMP-forming)/AMP-acid ligase II/thioesterase domain-containing protein/acyl carrier protein
MDTLPDALEGQAATIGGLLDLLETLGGAPALLAPGRPPLDFAGLHAQALEVRAVLAGRGLGPGDRVAAALPTGPEAAAAFLAVAATAAFAPLDPALSGAEFRRLLQGVGPAMLLLPPDGAAEARSAADALGIPVLDLRPRSGEGAGRFTLTGHLPTGPSARPALPEAEDVALVLHTSGTTGGSRRVPLRHRQLLAMARHAARSAGLAPRDRCLGFMPLHPLAGLVTAVLAALGAGGSLVCAPGFSPDEALRWLEGFAPTWVTAVPAVHLALADQAARTPGFTLPSTLRQVRTSAAPMPEGLLARLEAFYGTPVLEAYGMTETHMITANPPPPGKRKPGSVGLPAGPEVAVVDAEGRPVAPGETGEVVVRGPNVFDGYEDDPAANALAFRDGWFRTGDLGRFDEEGYLFLRGRVKELINRGGQKVSPLEVEEALLDHPAVAEAAAFPAPHPTLGEAVMAAVVPRPGPAPAERALRSHVAERLAPWKVPQRVAVLPEIPKGATGKIQRGALWNGLREVLERPPEQAGAPGPEAWEEAGATAAALERHPAVLRCAVQPRLDPLGARHLVAFVVLAGNVPSRDLLAFLLRDAPGTVLPSLFVALDAMPRDGEGRVDWQQLAGFRLAFDPAPQPLEPLERLVARLWAEVLPGRAPTLADDFFLSGGDSLRAVELLLRLEAETGASLSPETFFRDATLQGLVEALESRSADGSGDGPLVTVQAGAEGRPPLFLLHGDFTGGGLHCRRLASLLGPDLPVHALHPHGLPGQPQVSTVEAMAEAYLPWIRRVQPRGPYRLAGHCNGAVVAFELALRLQAEGDALARIVLLSPPPASRLGLGGGSPPLPPSADLRRQPPHLRRALLREAHAHALRVYAPEPCGAALHVLATDDDLRSGGPDLGWGGLGASLSVTRVPGTHLGMLAEHLEDTAAALRPLLD